MDYFKAFLIGGLICALAQILLDRTKLMPGRIMVLLVCSGAVLGARGGGQRAADRVWQSSVERGEGGCGPGGIPGDLPGRVQGQRRRDLRRPGLRLPCIPGL